MIKSKDMAVSEAKLRATVAASLTVPAEFNFVSDTFERWRSDRPCVLWLDDDGHERRISWAELADDVNRVANVLRMHGVRKGDRVFIQVGRRPEWWQTMLACLKIGAVATPGTTMLTERDIAYRMKLAEPAAVVTELPSAERFDRVRASGLSCNAYLSIDGALSGWSDFAAERDAAPSAIDPERTRPDDPAILFFTSGTTGLAKMVLHTHASYGIGHNVTARYWIGLTDNDLHWNISDTGWAKAAWSSFFSPFIVGAAQIIHSPSGGFDAVRTLDILGAHEVTSLCGPPTVFRSLVLQDLGRWTFPALASCVAAGEPLNPEVIDAWKRATGIEIRDGYGQTETCCVAGNFRGLPIKPGSMGKPSPGYEVAIVDDDGHPLPVDREGDIAIRVSPVRPVGMFKEYWKSPESNTASRRGDYYLTGDRGMTDSDGYIWFVGRGDDVILSAGYRIGPFEVESALLEHPAVAESAVVSSPDPIRGGVVKAFVVLKSGFVGSDELVAELQSHTKLVTAPYKYPRKIEFVANLPKTVSGKIRRVELRNKEWGRQSAESGDAPQPES